MSEERKEDFTGSIADMERHFREIFSRAGAVAPAQAQQRGQAEPAKAENDAFKRIREFSLKPHDVKAHLDRFVIRQDDAKKALSVAICDHYNHVRRCVEDPAFREKEFQKHNIILLGPSGVGKTYLVRCVAKLIGVPFVKADATKFSETGYVGHDVEDLVRDLVKAADGNVETAQYGIIYLDEVDKIASASNAGGRDVSGRGVQVNLLKLMEETDVGLFSQTDLVGQMQAIMEMQKGVAPGRRTINTRHILFIVSGAFDRLAGQVKRRVHASNIGFAASQPEPPGDSDYLRLASTHDFVEYGFEPEFVGRLPIRVVCDPLSVDDLEQIMLNSEGSILAQYKADFKGYGLDFSIAPEAVRAVAEKAQSEKTGARGLMTVLERAFREFKYELPSTALTSIDVSRSAIDDPAAALVKLMKHGESAQRDRMKDELKAFGRRFEEENGITLTFGRDAVEAVLELCAVEKKSVRAFCEARFSDAAYGLKLISRHTGKTSFAITRKFVMNPGDELSRRVAETFRSPA